VAAQASQKTWYCSIPVVHMCPVTVDPAAIDGWTETHWGLTLGYSFLGSKSLKNEVSSFSNFTGVYNRNKKRIQVYLIRDRKSRWFDSKTHTSGLEILTSSASGDHPPRSPVAGDV